ncbi:hypothetical protein PULV_a2024 [Pseudoalteromonas ulvae UL12]|uniref:GGDEF domain-containing protein n=1 Tax=Pseudoalteromonas ulvae TaxID=107327 RepID=UPI00186B8C64|nr:GGDEF domain-containing protein [Pseudoalteromonas ulvae]MBE0365258.1 hypothetical protein [Pseudoalteromonas ulvae UL12]
MTSNSAYPCAHEWIISLTQQEDEKQLDLILITALQTILFGCQLGVYISKFINEGLAPQQIYFGHDAIVLNQEQSLEYLNKVKKSKLHLHETPENSNVAIPVYHFGKVIGFVIAKGAVVGDLAKITVAIHVLNIYANHLYLLYRSQLDPLTELLNRQIFDLKLLEMITEQGYKKRRADYKEQRMWFFAMLDIDFFKSVNDNFGHMIGDEVLLLIARIIKNHFRSEDYIFRYGGEEFAILFQCQQIAFAADMLEKLREKVAQFNFPQVQHVTVSIGFTPLLQFEMVPSLVQKADQALYFSKSNGRDRVSNFTDIDPHTLLKHQYGHQEPELF